VPVTAPVTTALVAAAARDRALKVAVHDEPDVRLVDEVRRASDVVQRRRLALPLLQLPRVRDEPDVHAVDRREALDLHAGTSAVWRVRSRKMGRHWYEAHSPFSRAVASDTTDASSEPRRHDIKHRPAEIVNGNARALESSLLTYSVSVWLLGRWWSISLYGSITSPRMPWRYTASFARSRM
jgi:hypothetical protein